MRKLTLALVTAAIFAAGCLHLNELSLEERIAARHKVLVSDDCSDRFLLRAFSRLSYAQRLDAYTKCTGKR